MPNEFPIKNHGQTLKQLHRVFLTGATGVVGSSVLKELLTKTKAEIVVLMRGAHVEKRLSDLLEALELNIGKYRARIQLVAGDIEVPSLGLATEKLQELACTLTDIIHCAARVDLDQPESQAIALAQKSTENILALLQINAHIRLQYVSTVGVNGRRNCGLTENAITERRDFFNTYEKSKALAEEIVFRAIAQGKRITVHRPSMVVGNSSTGKIMHFQVFYFLLRLISGELTRGFVPDVLHRKLDTIPCDFVAEVLVECLERNDLEGKVVHLCSGPQDSWTLRQMVDLFRKFKSQSRLRIVPITVFQALGFLSIFLPKGSKWKKRLTLLPQFMSYASQDQIFLNEQSRAYFPHRAWPPPQDYLPNVLRYFVQAKGLQNG